jgi:3-phosphoshikimate 1-carboxyvinyltransferase
MSSIRLERAPGPLNARVTISGSKSLTNRALIAAALANGTSILSDALFAEDTQRMIDTLGRLGFAIATDPRGNRIEITGNGGFMPEDEADCFCGNSGTTIRFGTALASLGHGIYNFDGVERMRQRPIGQLGDALRALGAQIEYPIRDGYPPIRVVGQGLSAGTARVDRPDSSQFISAILLAAPAASGDVMVEVRGPLPSRPYVVATTRLMSDFGPAVIEEYGPSTSKFIIPAPQPYQARHYRIEPDASNASYFLAAPAVAGGSVTVDGLGSQSVQGDARFVDLLERMGCRVERDTNRLTVTGPKPEERLRGIDVDLNHMPDMVQTLAVVALFAEGPTTIRNVANLRLKETDRLAALCRELDKLGARTEELSDGLIVHPPEDFRPAAIDTYGDHRMAMSFAIAGLAIEGVVINDAACVAKTFPDFFDRWRSLSGRP